MRNMNFYKILFSKGKRPLFIFFGGKGGVGKSTLSAATAFWLANHDYKTLLISTDLQRSLDDIFQQEIGVNPTRIFGIENLWALNTDVGRSITNHQLRQIKAVEEIKGKKAPELEFLKVHYQGYPCCETASFNRMTEFMNTREFDVLVFDTAPGGHSLQTLRFPAEKARNLYQAIHDRTLPARTTKEIEFLKKEVKLSDKAARLLGSGQTKYYLVIHPERLPLIEGLRMEGELERTGIRIAGVVVNGVLPEDECKKSSKFFQERREMQERYIKEAKSLFRDFPLINISLLSTEVIGIEALKGISTQLFGNNV